MPINCGTRAEREGSPEWLHGEARDRFRVAAGGGTPIDDATWDRARLWGAHFAILYLLPSADSERLARMGDHLLHAAVAWRSGSVSVSITPETSNLDERRVVLLWVGRLITWLVYAYLIVVQIILLIGSLLLLFGASQSAGFVSWSYRNLDRVMAPLRGIFTLIELGTTSADVPAVIDTSILFAMIVYGILVLAIAAVVAWLTSRLHQAERTQQADYAPWVEANRQAEVEKARIEQARLAEQARTETAKAQQARAEPYGAPMPLRPASPHATATQPGTPPPGAP